MVALVGMSRRTGRLIGGLNHLMQSIADILSTRKGTRRERPEYGSDLPAMVDLPVTRGWMPSTAAGRYQILTRWWRIYQAQMKLPDFGPVSQDRYALQQLREHGALPLIDAGRFREAVAKVSNVWASLPGAGYGQHENDIEHLLAAYRAAGGEVVA